MGEGKVKYVNWRDRNATTVVAALILSAVFVTLFVVAWNFGEGHALETKCPAPPVCPKAPECPKPTCLTDIPRNCGRIGEGRLLCLRHLSDRLRFGVETDRPGPDDPVIFYTPKELLEDLLPDGGVKER